MNGFESIMIRSLSSGCLFLKKRTFDEATAMGRFLLGALAPIILKWLWSVQRGESALLLDFDGNGNVWNPAPHLLLTAEKRFSCPRRVDPQSRRTSFPPLNTIAALPGGYRESSSPRLPNPSPLSISSPAPSRLR